MHACVWMCVCVCLRMHAYMYVCVSARILASTTGKNAHEWCYKNLLFIIINTDDANCYSIHYCQSLGRCDRYKYIIICTHNTPPTPIPPTCMTACKSQNQIKLYDCMYTKNPNSKNKHQNLQSIPQFHWNRRARHHWLCWTATLPSFSGWTVSPCPSWNTPTKKGTYSEGT